MSRKFAGTINSYRADPSGWAGSAIMFAFAVLAIYRWQISGLIFFLLFALRDVTASWFLLTRNIELNQNKSRWLSVLAYVSTGFPFLYLSSNSNISDYFSVITSLLTILGFGIATWALFDLGGSFGLTPANRGYVKNGVYKYIKHPMYTGYIIAEFGFVLLNPINIILWITSVIFYSMRMKQEDKLLR